VSTAAKGHEHRLASTTGGTVTQTSGVTSAATLTGTLTATRAPPSAWR
jgi:hypothetical protein